VTLGRRAFGDQPQESARKQKPGAYVKICVLAVGSGVAYFAFAARWPGEPTAIRLILAAGLVAINVIGDCVALRQRCLGEIWSATHPVDALDRKPKPTFELG
jgi:hypothetical protein